MKKTFHIAALALGALVMFGACDRSSTSSPGEAVAGESEKQKSDHPAADAAERFLRALQYSDTRTATKTHVESTHEGFYCQSEEFERVFEVAREKRSEESCDDAEALTNAALARLDDGARLAAQMLKVVCEQPDATCADYSRRVLEAQRDNWVDWTQTLQRFEIQRVLGDDARAVVYVDTYATPRGSPEHRTLEMKKIGPSWYVSDPMLETGDPDSTSIGSAGRREAQTDSPTEADFN